MLIIKKCEVFFLYLKWNSCIVDNEFKINMFHKGSCTCAAESERKSSNPSNLLVNASVGMWFFAGKESNADIPYVCIAFFVVEYKGESLK